jgi:pimeloyl-ACP methyl ester carboxylesterase
LYPMNKSPSKSRSNSRNILLFAICAIAIITFGISAFLAHRQAMVFIHPTRSLPTQSPSDLGIETWHDVSFLSSDGLHIGAWFIPAEQDTPSATLICIHGLGSNRESLLDQAYLLWNHGYNALLLDLRNHGLSGGDTTTMGYLEIRDVEGAFDYLLTRSEVDPNRIGLIGHSMGGAVAIRAAARNPQIKVTIAESTFTSLEDNIEQGVRALTSLPPFPFAPLIVWFGEREAGADIHLVRPIDDLPQIAPRPILFIHGEKDTLIDVSNVIDLFDAAQEPKELFIVPDAGHGGLMQADLESFENRLVTFLDTYLK